jgi:REP-associated tyrosine transposase
MKYDPQKHHRRSIRLKGYDYSQNGLYFITLVVKNRGCLFGQIDNGKMTLSNFGKIIKFHWLNIKKHFPFTNLVEFIIMPNHFHGIIQIDRKISPESDYRVGAMHSYGDDGKNDNNLDRGNKVRAMHSYGDDGKNDNNLDRNASPQQHPKGTKPGSLSAILQNFTSVTSRKINRIRKTPGQKLWQRNFYEHIIRDEKELQRIRDYIINNPYNWADDKLLK